MSEIATPAAVQAAPALTCGSWLDVALPHLDQDLVPECRRLPLRRLGKLLPEAMHGFEVRLGGGDRDEAVDLSIRVNEPDQARAVAVRSESPFLRSFLKTWANGRIRNSVIPELWMEFDLPGDPQCPIGGLPEPVLCAGLGVETPMDWFLQSFLPAFHQAELTPFQIRSMERFAELRPEGMSPAYVFSLQARGSRGLRIDTKDARADDMSPFLRQLISAEHAEAVEEVLPLVAQADGRHLSFDCMPEAFGSRIGLELSFRGQNDPRWNDLLDGLVDAGLCTAAEKAAILAWRGVDSAPSSSGSWPVDEEGAPAPGFCIRALSHLKLTVQPDHPAAAKVYLGIFHYVRRPKAVH